MNEDISIINVALTYIGENPITCVDDNNASAAAARLLYNHTLDVELASHGWSFAAVRAILPALSTPPAFGYAYRYQLPDDFLALYQFGGVRLPIIGGPIIEAPKAWIKEGLTILSDLPPPVNIRYGRKVRDATQLPAEFKELLAWRLAGAMSYKLADLSALRKVCNDNYLMTKREALKIHAIQEADETLPDNSWTLAATL